MTIVILIHTLLFLAFWLTNLPYQNTLNNFLVGATGLQVNFMVIFMVFAGLVALWSAARLALRRDIRQDRSCLALPFRRHILSGLFLR